MSDFTFAGIDKLKRNPKIEGETGTPITLGNTGITLVCLAASENNPRWKQRRADMLNEVKRLTNANASPARIRAYVAEEYARTLLIDWYWTDPAVADAEPVKGIPDAEGNLIPFGFEAAKAFLTVADDAFEALEAVVFNHQNFRGERINVVVDAVKN